MSKPVKHISRLREEFDTVICGVNGVLTDGQKIFQESIDTLIKMYQSGANIALASNSGLRSKELFMELRRNGVPMNIFYAIITAGEIAHFFLKNKTDLGKSYFSLSQNCGGTMAELDYVKSDSAVLSDFIFAETTSDGVDTKTLMPRLEQALNLQIPLVCVGNDTLICTSNGIKDGVGCLAEQYALMGGKILSFGKPDAKIAAYLTESLQNFNPERCLCIGDNMATDMRLGNYAGMKTLLITNGVHQLSGNIAQKVDELSAGFGLNVDYCMEKLEW